MKKIVLSLLCVVGFVFGSELVNLDTKIDKKSLITFYHAQTGLCKYIPKQNAEYIALMVNSNNSDDWRYNYLTSSASLSSRYGNYYISEPTHAPDYLKPNEGNVTQILFEHPLGKSKVNYFTTIIGCEVYAKTQVKH